MPDRASPLGRVERWARELCRLDDTNPDQMIGNGKKPWWTAYCDQAVGIIALADHEASKAGEIRRQTLEDAAKVADEWAAENLRMAMDSIHLDPSLSKGDFSPEAQKMTDRMQAHGAHHAGAYAGCAQVATAIRTLKTTLTGDRHD